MARPSYRGRRGGGPRRNEERNTQRPCRQFSRGRCRYGDNCHYPHADNELAATKTPQFTDDSPPKDAYRRWRRSLKQDPSGLSPSEIHSLWNEALEVISAGQQDLTQRIPRDIVDENETHGFRWVMATMAMQPASFGPRVADFLRTVSAFLKVVSSSVLLDCLSVETYVGDLYNFMGGSNGTRAVPFFGRVCGALRGVETTAEDDHPQSLDIISAVTVSLHQVIIRN
ncbi:hypothetical protein BJY04DRAFT_212283 [Aspergillus karnatakaensis]|uniref:zinc finger CCCH domain-containing protein n=1 Tax=Aspergillus karnatakaensis TaxID=1810916 RepID=UPI003CCDAED9